MNIVKSTKIVIAIAAGLGFALPSVVSSPISVCGL